MYVIKNALKCIGRAKGRNILIGVIMLVIAVSACIGLSIRQAAQNAREETLADLTVTATISFDRQSMMGQMGKPESGEKFDRDQFASMMGNASSLTLEEYQIYAKAEAVQDFHYTLTASLNGSDEIQPVSTETEEDESSSSGFGGFGGMMMPGGNMPGGKGGMSFAQSDFSIEGYNCEAAMTNFQEGVATITDGAIFEEGTDSYDCIISEELAAFNNLAVGDTMLLTNPNKEEETYTLNIKGIYTDSSANESSFSMMGGTFSDPANKIYMSYNALKAIVDASEEVATVETDEETGRETSTALNGQLSGTYIFADVESYEQFEEQARALGLDDSYTIASADISAYESSLTPLNTLSTMAGYFLLVILVIGAIILVVLNIFSVRERKYEIGVLMAMGMKKWKVATQFMVEIFAVTIIAVMLGAGIGAVSAVPVTNALLAGQIESQNSRFEQVEQNFGRGEMPGGMQMPGGSAPQLPSGGGSPFGDLFEGSKEYVTEINSAMNLTVVAQLLGIAILLTLAAGMVSMLFVMRYEPLKILANRD
ncbi:MAG: ABC transporter permease [Clostridia bacterium]|nr:ABC transporter permease [Clostridia bacterium]